MNQLVLLLVVKATLRPVSFNIVWQTAMNESVVWSGSGLLGDSLLLVLKDSIEFTFFLELCF